ncbi:MAG: GIY-YIG nuclease family protein [Candidatus Omnitrophica bacterium]|nr:GIY-YIG nuclease family protein [Candidatus Omnitrophota bacterium]
MKSGYLYVLVHPSDPNLVKIGITTLTPEERLAQHNSRYEEYTGQIVKKTGQKWELKTYIAVPDPSWAERVFWGATPLADIPFRQGIEVEKMEWEWVQAGLVAAKKAGVRPPLKPLPDWVYAYTKWMNKRLEGRDITLVGHVKSMVSGNATFQCSNGHEWRTRAAYIADGEGCPECGVGDRNLEEIWQAAKLGYLCLLINHDKPGVIKIGLTYHSLEQWNEGNIWEDWEVHRYRFVEGPVLAETLIWKLLDLPLPNDREPSKIDLNVAEQAFRDLIPEMHREIALAEKRSHPEN